MPEADSTPTADVVATLDEAALPLSPEDKQKQDRAVFDKLLKEEYATPTPKEDKAEEPDEPEEDATEEQAKPADPRVAAARKGLSQAGYPQASVDGASDEEALAWWNRHTEADFDRSTAKEQALELQRRLESLEKERQQPAEPEPEPFRFNPETLSKALESQFGDEAGKELSGAFMALLAPLEAENKALREEIGGLKNTWQQAEERSTKAMTAQNRSRLQERIPQLENDIAWKAIEDAAGTLINSGTTFLTADHLFDEAAKIVYGEDALAQPEDKTSKQKKKIRSASPTTEFRKRAPEPLSPEAAQHARDIDWFNETEKRRKAGKYKT